MHRLVIIGSLHENVQLVIEAKKRGYYTIVCDGYNDGAAKRFADKVYNIDIRKVDEIAEICENEKADGIIGSFSDLVFEQITKIADKAKLKWYATPEMLQYYRDKNLQKELLKKLGILTPKHMLVTPELSDDDYLSFVYPVLIKPINSWGSRNITVFYDPSELKKFIDGRHYDLFEIEEYCDAYEYNCISWVVDGAVKILGIADRERNPKETGTVQMLNRVVYPSVLYDELYDKVLTVLQRFVNSTGQKSGPLSMQFFYKNNQIVVCEIAGRVLAHEHKLIKMCNGSDINSLFLDYVYGDDNAVRRDIKPIDIEKYSCGLYFQCEKQKLVYDTSAADELLSKIDDDSKLIFCEKNEIFDDSHPYYARVYLCADTRKKLDDETEFLFENMCVKDNNNHNIIIPFYLEGRYKL